MLAASEYGHSPNCQSDLKKQTLRGHRGFTMQRSFVNPLNQNSHFRRLDVAALVKCLIRGSTCIGGIRLVRRTSLIIEDQPLTVACESIAKGAIPPTA